MPSPSPPCRTSDRRGACRLVDPDRRHASARRRSAPPSPSSTPAASSGTSESTPGTGPIRLGVPLGDVWSDRAAAATRRRARAGGARSATSSTRTRFRTAYDRVGRQHRWRPHRVGRRQPVQPRHRHAAAGRRELRQVTSAERFDGDILSSTRGHRRARRRQRLPDRDGVSRSAAPDSGQRQRQVRLVRRRRRAVAAGGRPAWAGPAATSCSSPTTTTGREIQAYQDLGFGADADDRPRRDLLRVRQLRSTSRAGRSRRRARSTRPRRRASSTRASASASRTEPIRSGGGRINTPRPQHPARRDRQPRAQGHRRRRRSRGGGFRGAAQRHGRRSPWPRLRRGDAEGGRLLWRPGDLRRPGVGPGRRAGHVEPQRRRRRHRAEPRARPRRCRREDPHLQLVGARPTWSPTSPAGSTPAVLNANGSGFTGVTPARVLRQPQQHRHHAGVVRRGRDPIGAGRAAGPAFRRTRRRSSSTSPSPSRRAPDSRPRSRPAWRSRWPPTSTTSPARRAPTSPSSRSAPAGRSR